MSSNSLIPVILSGGSGTRLWPLSRKLYPKQFIPLKENKSLFQSTLERITSLDNLGELLVICNDEHRFMAAEQLRQSKVNNSAIILEPIGRNTAPAITVAALHAIKKDKNAELLVLPADHIVRDISKFKSSVRLAQQVASELLLTFGVVPNRVETGFGYIKRGNDCANVTTAKDVYIIEEFVEKPDYSTAEKYVKNDAYFWNSGMFLFRADVFINELKSHNPAIYTACESAYNSADQDLDFIRLDEKSFATSPNISIDYAVMEKTKKAAVVPLESDWSDVGSWHALWEAFDRDGEENSTYGDIIAEDCSGSYIHANHRLVTAVGVKDQVIIETADAVLVAPRDRAQEVKDIVSKLKSAKRDEVDIHPKVYRPWGAYETIDIEDRFQVKRITVNPKQKLSLQMHHHRAEHWVVVKGTARVTRGEDEFLLSENESTYIPIGTKHRLENPGKIPLELIEVQSGTYLGEDDITRFEDVYGR